MASNWSYDVNKVREILDDKEKFSKPIFVRDGKPLQIYMPPSLASDQQKRPLILKLVELGGGITERRPHIDAIDVIDPLDAKNINITGDVFSIEWIVESMRKRKLQDLENFRLGGNPAKAKEAASLASPGKRHAFTDEQDKIIAAAGNAQEKAGKSLNVAFWRALLEEHPELKPHTWESLKERYRRHIDHRKAVPQPTFARGKAKEKAQEKQKEITEEEEERRTSKRAKPASQPLSQAPSASQQQKSQQSASSSQSSQSKKRAHESDKSKEKEKEPKGKKGKKKAAEAEEVVVEEEAEKKEPAPKAAKKGKKKGVAPAEPVEEEPSKEKEKEPKKGKKKNAAAAAEPASESAEQKPTIVSATPAREAILDTVTDLARQTGQHPHVVWHALHVTSGQVAQAKAYLLNPRAHFGIVWRPAEDKLLLEKHPTEETKQKLAEIVAKRGDAAIKSRLAYLKGNNEMTSNIVKVA